MKTKVIFFSLMALIMMAFSPRETYTFKGYVQDKNTGESIIGANVLIKGTKIGTTTNINGYFELEYHQKEATLLVNYIGFETKEVPVNSDKEVKVKMEAAIPNSILSLRGLITDDNGNPLIGASIVESGTTNGTLTDFDGLFNLSLQSNKKQIEVSYTGYQTTLLPVDGKNFVKVQLKTGVSLDEVVVVDYKVPLVEQDNTTSGTVVTSSRKERKKNKSKRNQPQAYMAAPSPSIAYDAASGMGYHHPYAAEEAYNTEDYGLIQENRFLEVSKKPLSTFSIDVDAASYSNMRRFINSGQRPPVDAVRIEEMVNYFTYEYNEPKGEDPFNVITEISDCPWNKQSKLLHIGLQGKRIPTEHLPASNLVFLIDVSGSMQSTNKLPLLQTSYKLLADQLREKDRVAIVVYAGAAGLVLPSTSGADKQAIKAAIDQLRAGGSTAGSAGIKLAYQTARENFVEGGNNRVILATDGDFNVGASSDAALVRLIEKERESGIFLTVMGFGTGNYKDNKMQELANKGNGNHAYIDNISEAKKVLVNEFGGTLFTIAKDVKLQLEFNPAKVAGYRLIGYENRLLNDEDFNDDKKDAGELGAGHTVTALYEIIPAGTESPYLAAIDDLKYQEKVQVKKSVNKSAEWLTVKLRYKQPEGSKSKKLEHIVGKSSESKAASANFRWSAAVASAGMLLRDSKFKGQATFRQTIDLAKSAKGKDVNGYRQEFINMMEVMSSVVTPEVAQRED